MKQFTPRLIFALCFVALTMLGFVRVDPLHAQPATTKEHWFQYLRGEEQVGVLKVEVVRDEAALTLRDTLMVFDHEHEIQVHTEVRYRGKRGALRATSASVTVSRGADTMLTGSLRFDGDEIIEAYRAGTQPGSSEATPLTERRHKFDGDPLLTIAGVAFLAPELLESPGEMTVFFPAFPRGLRGPLIGDTSAIYRLTKTSDAPPVYRVEGRHTDHRRDVEATTVKGKVTEIKLLPHFRLVKSRRSVCTQWHRKRSGATVDAEPPKEDSKQPSGDAKDDK